MRKPNSSKLGRTVVKRKLMALGRMLALRGGEVDSPPKPLETLAAAVGGSNMQIVCASVLEYDLDYMKYLTIFKESNHHPPYLLEREASPLRIMYTTDDKEVKRRGRRRKSEKPPLVSSVSKKLKSGTRKEDHQLTVFRKEVVLRGRKVAMTKIPIKAERRSKDGKDTEQKKEASLQRKKTALPKNIIKLEPTSNGGKDTKKVKEVSLHKNPIKVESTSDVKETHQEKEVTRRGRKPKNANPQAIFRASKRLRAEKIIPVVNTKDVPQGEKSSVTKRTFKECKKENEESNSEKRKAKPQEIFRASKRLKTDQNWVNNKDTKGKKEEVILVNKDKAKPKSTSHVKDSLLHSFKSLKKVANEDNRLLMDKSYDYFLAYLRNSVTVLELKPEKASVPLSDPDIIAVSNCPFSDGGPSPFEANKDGKVIDLEDRIEPEDMFNSTFSKKLLEILRQPYDKDEFKQRFLEVSQKKQLTRSRQLRDGREIEYNVDHQLGPSYLDRYPDFKRVFRTSRFAKDESRALNLLRGFFFYFENIVLEGAFRPWLHEARVMKKCKDIVCIK
ncbi:T142 protein [Hirschfeldia incana]|nr:T142 protein [Hirschfeldia incana]